MSSNDNIHTSVVIPAYNEGARLGATLQAVGTYLNRRPEESEIIVVDDGSRDNTIFVAQSHSLDITNVRILQHETNYGKGWAVKTGMLSARGKYRLFMDADGSTDIHHWDAMRDALDEGADVVVGSRHVEGSHIRIHQAAHREALGALFRKMVQHGFKLPVLDTQNGFKAFTARAAERIFRRQRVPGWAFDVEILSIARDLGYRAVELPITWIDDNRSRMTLSAMPRMLLELLRIKIGAIQSSAAPRVREIPQWA